MAYPTPPGKPAYHRTIRKYGQTSADLQYIDHYRITHLSTKDAGLITIRSPLAYHSGEMAKRRLTREGMVVLLLATILQYLF